MGRKIRILLGVFVILGTMYWAFDAVRSRNYSGSRLNVDVGNGQIVVTNRGSEPVPVEMRTSGRSSTFRIESAELDLRESSKRQGSGREAYQGLSFELPPGQATINVIRGSGVKFISSGSERLDAVVTPKSPEGTRGTLTLAGIVVLGALFYISRTLEHSWLKELVRRIPRGKKGAATT